MAHSTETNKMPIRDEWVALFNERLAWHTASMEFPEGKPDDVGTPVAVPEQFMYSRLVDQGVSPQWAGRRIEQVFRDVNGPLVRVHTKADLIEAVDGYVGYVPTIWITSNGLAYLPRDESNGVQNDLRLVMLREAFTRLVKEWG